MSTIKILVDSGCDATKEQIEALGVDLVPLVVTIEDKEFDDYYQIDKKEYYHTLRTSINIPSTAQPSPATFIKHFEKYMATYSDILIITMSVGGSGTYNSAMIAKGMYEETYPEATCAIHVHDSWSTSLVEFMQVKHAAALIKENKDIQTVLQELDALKRRITTFYLVDDIVFLVKGGRVSNLKGSVLNTFNIKPIIAIVGGQGSNHSIAMGMKNGMTKLASIFAKEADDKTILYVSHCDAYENAMLFIEKVKETYPNLKYLINPMYATMATHAGPGTIGVFYERNK